MTTSYFQRNLSENTLPSIYGFSRVIHIKRPSKYYTCSTLITSIAREDANLMYQTHVLTYKCRYIICCYYNGGKKIRTSLHSGSTVNYRGNLADYGDAQCLVTPSANKNLHINIIISQIKFINILTKISDPLGFQPPRRVSPHQKYFKAIQSKLKYVFSLFQYYPPQ